MKKTTRTKLAALALGAFVTTTTAFAGTGAGNGGHPIELRATKVITEIQEFFAQEKNRDEFPEIDFRDFIEVVPQVKVEATDEELFDMYGNKRCLTNVDTLININVDCWSENLKAEAFHYPILFHELLGMLGIETAGKYVPSEYPVSSRLGKFVHKKVSYGLLNIKENLNDLYFSCSAPGRKMDDLDIQVRFNGRSSIELYAKKMDPSNFTMRMHEFADWIRDGFGPGQTQMSFEQMNFRGTYKYQKLDGEAVFFNKENKEISFSIDPGRYVRFSLDSALGGNFWRVPIVEYMADSLKVSKAYVCRRAITEYRGIELKRKAENELSGKIGYYITLRGLTDEEIEQYKALLMNL